MKTPSLLIQTLCVLLFSALTAQAQQDSLNVVVDSTAMTEAAPMTADTVTMIGVGDIMMGTNYPENKLPPDGGAFLLRGVESILADADMTFGNLEGTLLNTGGTPKTCKDPKVCYVFRTPVSYVSHLTRAGFDMVSLANNHAGDFGEVGRQSTMRTLDSAGIAHAGQLTRKFTIFEKDSVRYGLVAFAPNSGCVPLNDMEGARALVMQLDSLCDITIVSFHGGAEGAQYQNVPRQREIFHGEDRGDVYTFAHTLIDAGADVIFGHGPHVTRAVEVYKERFIIYSMGNFCTYRGISVNGVNGLAPIVKLYTDRAGRFLKGQLIPTYQTYATGVRVDPENQVIKKIQELTKKDFPECPVHIAGDGLITYLAQ